MSFPNGPSPRNAERRPARSESRDKGQGQGPRSRVDLQVSRTPSEAGCNGTTAAETILRMSSQNRMSSERDEAVAEEEYVDAQGFRYRPVKARSEFTAQVTGRAPVKDQQAPILKRSGTGLGLKRLVGGIGFGSKKEKGKGEQHGGVLPRYRDPNARRPETAAEVQARLRWEEHQKKTGLVPDAPSPSTFGDPGREHHATHDEENDTQALARASWETQTSRDAPESPARPLVRSNTPLTDRSPSSNVYHKTFAARTRAISPNRIQHQEDYVYTPPPPSATLVPARAETFPKDGGHAENRDSDHSHKQHYYYNSVRSQALANDNTGAGEAFTPGKTAAAYAEEYRELIREWLNPFEDDDNCS